MVYITTLRPHMEGVEAPWRANLNSCLASFLHLLPLLGLQHPLGILKPTDVSPAASIATSTVELKPAKPRAGPLQLRDGT